MYQRVLTPHLLTPESVGEECRSLRDMFGNSGCESICRILDRDQSGSFLRITFQFKQLERRSLKKSGLQRGKSTAMITLYSHLQPQYKYELFHVNFTSFHCMGRYELSKLTSLPMCGFIAQLVEHRTGIAEVMGSNPVEALIFSGFFFPIA